MTLNETSPPLSMVGPVRYELWIDAHAADEDDIGFVVNGSALPRVGDTLTFEGEEAAFMVTVEGVAHSFYAATERAPHRMIAVTAAAQPGDARAVGRLRDPARLEKWIAEFPMLEPL